MATPSLKTRTEWCLSLRSSEHTTPPNRGPTSGEPPAFLFPAGQFGATAAVSNGNIWSSAVVRACASSTEEGFGTWNGQRRVTLCSLWKREKKNKEQNKTCSLSSCSYVSSRHDEHCAFLAVCGLKFFTVLAQFVGVNLSIHLRNDSFQRWAKKPKVSLCSIEIKLLNTVII